MSPPSLAGLGHEVIAPQIEVSEVGLVTAREQSDVALVGLGKSSEHALELIEQIVHEAACPVVALLHAPDPGFVLEAAKRGVFAYITDGEPQEWQNSIEIVLRRFGEFRDSELTASIAVSAARGARSHSPSISIRRHQAHTVRRSPASLEGVRHSRERHGELADPLVDLSAQELGHFPLEPKVRQKIASCRRTIKPTRAN